MTAATDPVVAQGVRPSRDSWRIAATTGSGTLCSSPWCRCWPSACSSAAQCSTTAAPGSSMTGTRKPRRLPAPGQDARPRGSARHARTSARLRSRCPGRRHYPARSSRTGLGFAGDRPSRHVGQVGGREAALRRLHDRRQDPQAG